MIRNPNLQNGKCSHIVMSAEYPNFIVDIKQLGINVIETVESEELPYYERFHADMQIHNCGCEKIFLRNSCSIIGDELKIFFPKVNIKILDKKFNNKYPNNISLNGAFIGDYYICQKNHSDKDLLLWYINNGIEIIDVSQGYAKCSTAIISNNAIITDDEAIYKVCKKLNSIDVLKISKGSVKLKGYDYGFIGGCCFKADKNSLVFFGNPKLHTDYENIKAFCKNYGIELIALNNDKLIDIGGAVVVF